MIEKEKIRGSFSVPFYDNITRTFLIDICFNLSVIEGPLRNSTTFLLSHCVSVKLQAWFMHANVYKPNNVNLAS